MHETGITRGVGRVTADPSVSSPTGERDLRRLFFFGQTRQAAASPRKNPEAVGRKGPRIIFGDQIEGLNPFCTKGVAA